MYPQVCPFRYAAAPLAALLLLLTATLRLRADDSEDANKKLSSAAFLELVRRPPMQDSWARMRGTVTAQAEGKTTTMPISFRARFAPDKLRAQVVLNDYESYLVAQVFADGMAGTTVVTEQPPKAGVKSLADVGLRPGDLTLSFLYWQYVAELAPDTIRGQDCRIFRLRHPQVKEEVTVAIATRYLFPLRVEWYQQNASEPYRRLEFTNFKRKDEIWIVNEAVISNTGWRTKVNFDELEVKRITPTAPVPADLFTTSAATAPEPATGATTTVVTPATTEPAPAPAPAPAATQP